MKLIYISLILGLVLNTVVAEDNQQLSSVALLSESSLKKAESLRDAALNDNLAWSIVESLTTEIGPRMGGSKNDVRAVEWAELKLKSLGFDKVWKEPVTFPSWIRGVERGKVLSPYPQKLVLTALGGSIATPVGGMQGEIIQFNSLEDLIAADPKLVKGKVAFISKKMSRYRDGHGYSETVSARSKGASEASLKGATAILIRSVGTDSDRFPHTGMMGYREGVAPIPAAALSNPDADLIMNMLRRKQPVLVNIELGSHFGKDHTSYNVIGEITGSTKPDDIILLGAHLDSWDLGTGAIDDGAGVAIVVAAAEQLKLNKPKRTVRVVLFANEEQGLYGGKQYAIEHEKTLKKHIVGVESDYGAGKVWKFSTHFKKSALAAAKQIHTVLEPLGIEFGDNKANAGPDLIHSKMAGMAVVSLYQDGTDYFDYHHTANDTLDKINPEALSQNVAAYVGFVWLMSELDGDVGFFGKTKSVEH